MFHSNYDDETETTNDNYLTALDNSINHLIASCMFPEIWTEQPVDELTTSENYFDQLNDLMTICDNNPNTEITNDNLIDAGSVSSFLDNPIETPTAAIIKKEPDDYTVNEVGSFNNNLPYELAPLLTAEVPGSCKTEMCESVPETSALNQLHINQQENYEKSVSAQLQPNFSSNASCYKSAEESGARHKKKENKTLPRKEDNGRNYLLGNRSSKKPEVVSSSRSSDGSFGYRENEYDLKTLQNKTLAQAFYDKTQSKNYYVSKNHFTRNGKKKNQDSNETPKRSCKKVRRKKKVVRATSYVKKGERKYQTEVKSSDSIFDIYSTV